MQEHDPDDVVDAELVEDDEGLFPVPADPGQHPRPLIDPALLPAPARPAPEARPLVDRHTMLRPGAAVPTTADGPQYTEADFRVSQRTADRMDTARPANTSRAYGHALGKFEAWCAEQGRVPVPCTTATFTEYVVHLVDADLAPSSVQVAMSAIRGAHPEGQQPGMRAAREILRAHAKERASRRAARKAAPITDGILSAMVATCDAETGVRRPAGTRDAALLTLGWGMLSRRSELSNLLIEHLDVQDDGVTVLVAFSKTDQAAAGETTFVPAVPDDPSICPVVRVRAWLEELRRHGHTAGPLLRPITRHGTIPARPEGRDRLSPDSVGAAVKARAVAAEVPDPSRVTAHGLRRGPAQAIADAGGDPTRQGRWKPGSNTVRKHYTEPAQGKANNPLTAVHRKRAEDRARVATMTEPAGNLTS
ncbi:integrase [Streptomyces sp. NPDC090112]|uniref:integrase n=1 Tax=Streptomyces sp. NPDC090112 TaxID=3365949 RepID=UPI003810ECEA